MPDIAKRTLILTGKWILIWFLALHMMLPTGNLYFGPGSAILIGPIASVAAIYVLLREVERISTEITSQAVLTSPNPSSSD